VANGRTAYLKHCDIWVLGGYLTVLVIPVKPYLVNPHKILTNKKALKKIYVIYFCHCNIKLNESTDRLADKR
jgi:hypothetical protein